MPRKQEQEPLVKGKKRSLSDRVPDDEYSYGERYGRHEFGHEAQGADKVNEDSFGFAADDLNPEVQPGGTGEAIVKRSLKRSPPTTRRKKQG